MQSTLTDEVWMGRSSGLCLAAVQGCLDLSAGFHQPQDRAAYGELFEMGTHMGAPQVPLRLYCPNTYTLDTLPRPLLPDTLRNTQQTPILSTTELPWRT